MPICPTKKEAKIVSTVKLKTVNYVRFEVFAAVTMKNAVFWDVTPCRSCKNRRFGGTPPSSGWKVSMSYEQRYQ
jgi:hypothetical protein